jgi:transposase
MNDVEADVEGVMRRRRSIAEKRRIVEETLVAGTSVAAVARSRGINANQLFSWRKLYKTGRLGPTTAPRTEDSISLLPVRIQDESRVCEPLATAPGEQPQQESSGTIHIHLGEVRLRLEGRVDAATLQVVLESLRR